MVYFKNKDDTELEYSEYLKGHCHGLTCAVAFTLSETCHADRHYGNIGKLKNSAYILH